MNDVKYRRRRQFLLSPEQVVVPGWQNFSIAVDAKVSVHPDLKTTCVGRTGRGLTALGYIIDPHEPNQGEAEILERMLRGTRDIEDIISGIERLCGRFVLIVDLGNVLYLFHDAGALRQVQYCRDLQGRVWCASQAESLAERLDFRPDDEVLNYRKLRVFHQGTEFWLLNNRTPYREIRNLLPNHYLDLKSGEAHRYWPRGGSLKTLSMRESTEKCAPILINTLKAASQRFDLHMGMSAGIDSRKTLAAAKECQGDITYFTHGTSEETLNINDVKVPARLLPRLGLTHDALPLLPMSEEFKELFQASSTWARESKGKNAYTILNRYGSEVYVLNSNISEVAQSIYYLPKSELSGRGLAIINGLNHPFAIEEFQKWLDGALPACEEAGMDVLALFFLEQRMGRWCTAAFCEYDIAFDTVNPYNNRELHSLMLGVPERMRRDRRWEVPLDQIRFLWPDVLKEPINPQDRIAAKVQQSIRRFVIHKTVAPWLPLYPYLRFLKKRRRFLQMND